MSLSDGGRDTASLEQTSKVNNSMPWRLGETPSRWAVLLLWASLAAFGLATALLVSSYLLPTHRPG